MIRLRRCRVLLFTSVAITFLLLQLINNSRQDPAAASLYDSGHSIPNSIHRSQPEVARPDVSPEEDDGSLFALPNPPAGVLVPAEMKVPGRDKGSPSGKSIPYPEPGTVEDMYRGEDHPLHMQKPPGAFEGPVDPTSTTIRWTKVTEQFPIPEESLILLPTGKPLPIPTVQHLFRGESEAEKLTREARLARVKAEAEHAWSGYKQFAWTHDELMPVSMGFRDPFCGWAATIVDSLDTLWIMGMKDDFDDAVQVVKNIDFTTTPFRSDIPLFETVIRYLGGLLGAYDVSGGHSGNYKVLLDKAVELAEILMGAFDTPNRMPALSYQWKPAFASQPKRASPRSSIAELGSMSMEFTRLAQLTGENKYYDAVARITDALEDWQNRGTTIPGIFPEVVDASGCDKTSTTAREQSSSNDALAQRESPETVAEPTGYVPEADRGQMAPDGRGDGEQDTEFQVSPGAQQRDPITSTFNDMDERNLRTHDPDPLAASRAPFNWDCPPQGLKTAGFDSESFSMGGSQDSTYEYFPKEFLLLGGLETKYRAMHESVVRAIKEHLLYRPMTVDNRDILFSGKATGKYGHLTLRYEVTHLACFLGGMFALGGKIFDSLEDVEMAARLTDGCVWAYDTFPTGIMPEVALVTPCEDATECHWNETLWWQKIDPNFKRREEDVKNYPKKKEMWEQNMERLRQEAALLKQSEEGGWPQEDLRGKGEKAAGSPRIFSVSDAVGARTEADSTVPYVSKRGVVDYSKAAEGTDKSAQVGEKMKLESGLDMHSPPGNRSETGTKGRRKSRIRFPPEPAPPISHEEYVRGRIRKGHLQPGFLALNSVKYILRPEAIESVWYMYRITGDPAWQEKGWKMFEAIIAVTRTEVGHSAIADVSSEGLPELRDNMESFWIAETLKYFYLLFTTPDVISLDEWVLNTEAHPFKRPV